jgi:hypothetical protein
MWNQIEKIIENEYRYIHLVFIIKVEYKYGNAY